MIVTISFRNVVNNMGHTIFKGRTKSGEEFYLRYPREEDLEILLNFINTLSLEKTFIRFQGEQLTLDEEKKTLDEWLKGIRERKLVKLLVFVGNDLAGTAEITMRDKVGAHVGNLGISIAKEFRGKGFGEILLRKILKEAKKNLPGLKIVNLGCFSNNSAAINLYSKLGFKENGRLPDGIKHKGKFVDAVYMYKTL